MESQALAQTLTLIGTLGGAFIAGTVTLISQYITKKYENEKIKKQLLFKVLEDELKEKKQIIKPLIQFINSMNLPANFNFYDDGDLLDQDMLNKKDLIKSKISDFLLDYALYMTPQIHDAIWIITDAINDLEELTARLYDPSLTSEENEEIILHNCGNKPSKIWSALMKLKELLYSEIKLADKL
ncbi:hypothetical protein [Escherichia fergusonii]|uniref:hypothetical protein n=1 Tax=Escherichia fergusonii TaxID=564 RepID=UPI001CD18AB1|nr:hypothetical protein [Escherichia fergusonii]